MKRKRFRFILLFFLFLIFLSLFTFLLPAKTFSMNENRPLAQMPKFSMTGIQNGTLQSGLADYLSDQVPFREFWMKTKTAFQKLSGKQEINGVYIGKDGYYFQQFTDESYSSDRMMSVFRMLDTFVQKHSLPTSIMLVPTSGTILTRKLPAYAPYYNANLVYDAAKQILSCPVIDLRDYFSENAEDLQLYYCTDHHWTAHGAYLAYQQYCQFMKITPKEYALEQVSDNFYGTIYSKLLDGTAQPDCVYAPVNLPAVEITYEDGTTSTSPYQPEQLEEKDKYTYFFGGNHGKISIQTPSPSESKLLIIKDSFANSFVPYLFEYYSQIIMLDLRYFSGNVDDVIQEYDISQILLLYETSNFLTDTGILNLQKY